VTGSDRPETGGESRERSIPDRENDGDPSDRRTATDGTGLAAVCFDVDGRGVELSK